MWVDISFFLVVIVAVGLLFLFIGNTASNPYVMSTLFIVVVLASIVVFLFVLAYQGVITSGTLERMLGKIIDSLPMLRGGGPRSVSGSEVNASDGDVTKA